VQILYFNEAVRLVCANLQALRRAFGAAWERVAHCLTVLFNAANLAEVRQMASVTVRRVADTASEFPRFVVGHGGVEVTLQAVGAADDPDELSLLQRVRVIAIEKVAMSAAIPV